MSDTMSVVEDTFEEAYVVEEVKKVPVPGLRKNYGGLPKTVMISINLRMTPGFGCGIPKN